jgi:hypothetical protein
MVNEMVVTATVTGYKGCTATNIESVNKPVFHSTKAAIMQIGATIYQRQKIPKPSKTR